MAEVIEGMAALQHRLTRLLREVDQPSPSTVSRVTSHLITSVQTNFTSGGRPGWTPRKRSYPHPPLMKTKALYNSIGTIHRVEHGTIEVGTTCEYAGYQHGGTKKNGQQAIDPRPFMVWQDSDIEVIASIILEEIDRLL